MMTETETERGRVAKQQNQPVCQQDAEQEPLVRLRWEAAGKEWQLSQALGMSETLTSTRGQVTDGCVLQQGRWPRAEQVC